MVSCNENQISHLRLIVNIIVADKIMGYSKLDIHDMLWLTCVSSENTFVIALGENQRGKWNHDQKNTIFHI